MKMKRGLVFPFLALTLTSCVIHSADPSSASSTLLSSEASSLSSSEAISSSSKAESSSASSSQASSSSSSLSSKATSSSSSIAQSSSADVAPCPTPWLKPTGDIGLGRQFYLNAIGDIFQTWETIRGDGITIAVVDVGFNPYHEDFYYNNLAHKVSPLSASFTTGSGGTTTEVGIDKVVNMGESHGTFCAGVAAAAINGKGVVGIAPNANLLLLKTDAKPKSICQAFRYAADNGARVISVSIGSYYDYTGDLVSDGSDLSKVFDEPVAYCKSKGTVVISAAGNGGLDGRRREYTYPGATKGVIGVGGLAANEEFKIWSGSSLNPEMTVDLDERFVDCFAPADQMYGCCHYDGKKYDGGWNGTSFAAPQVAGMAALYFEKYPTATVDDFTLSLNRGCRKFADQGVSREIYNGFGSIDIGKLFAMPQTGTFKAKVSINWMQGYLYAWNLTTEQENAPWPGVSMTKVSGGFTKDIDYSKYTHLIFNNGSGSQTVNLHVSAFRYGAAYNPFGEGSYDGKSIGIFQ